MIVQILLLQEKEHFNAEKASIIIMIGMQLKLLFSLCLVSRPFLPHPSPGFILVVVAKGEFWPAVSIQSNLLED